MKPFLKKNAFLVLLVFLAAISLFSFLSDSNSDRNTQPYSTFVQEIDQNKISQVQINQTGQIKVTLKSGDTYNTILPMRDDKLLDQLISKDITVIGKLPERPSALVEILINMIPLLLFLGLYLWFMRRMTGGMASAMGNDKQVGRVYEAKDIKTRLSDVAGCEEAKREVSEIVDFLRDPQKFTDIGARIPKGVLMVGPPGTGKTLLARAVAGEAGVPFITIAGSDFVEMFAGVGAQRVRAIFAQAKKFGKAIIFIDEIDAVGRKRGAGFGGGHDEREQTLNQLLVEMDGFDEKTSIIVIAATNRADVLDNALVRPGRFDRQVTLDLPDLKGRLQILQVHAKRVRLARDVNLKTVARGTPGFSGAELANLINEAALMSARQGNKEITMKYFELAQDKITLGTERPSLTMKETDRLRTAYHEAGHAIVGYLVEGNDPVHKVTIIPRGRALGVTHFLPTEDQVYQSFSIYEAKLQMTYGGRLAEEIIFGKDYVSTGASSDIQYASRMARAMVTTYGFDDDLGPINYAPDQNDPYGRPQASDAFAERIDQAVLDIIKRNYDKARLVLQQNRDILEAMKDALIEYETIDKWQVERIMNREPAGKPRDWDDDSDQRNFEHLKD
ncbi:ATP-dependent zinc metalloprotease FtsH [Psittacicella gerlachiana]|uniref:ATP-dependent zinc metalloprotease FtsH n=1 Tax=Psittacicella gerlachiana TaxID=2028574 RepID=A0A3A1YEU2_9GAMM|nr:ATP-dependent zinc metalloprotease FtsH [Psittacicella gerlachiana]RIY34734.1 ATP-dependent metalloprotease [Psittacicella gerlachiana]